MRSAQKLAVAVFTVTTMALALLGACTRAKPAPPPVASPMMTAAGPAPQGMASAPPGATVVSVGPAPAYSAPSASVAPLETPSPAPTQGPAPANPTPAPLTPEPSSTYTVAYGDTLFSIARRFGTSVQAIADANSMLPSALIRAGQVLTIPGARPQGVGEYVVQPGDTLYSIASRYGTTAEAIASANQIVNPSLLRVGQRLVIPAESEALPATAKIHVVQAGETLYRIALMYGKTAQEIAVANNLASLNSIRIGQRLVIP